MKDNGYVYPNKYYEDFCREAKYCAANEGNKPYYIRHNGQFLCSAETDDLYEQYAKLREGEDNEQ